MPVEGRSLSSRATQEAVRFRRLGNLSTPESVQKLRAALHAKAKQVPSFRFYALVICCNRQAEEALQAMRQMMGRLKLVVNEEKTQVCRVPQEHFDFLGYNFGRCYSTKTGRAYLGTRPSKKSIRRMVEQISAETRGGTSRDTAYVVGQLNRKLQGWANYFCLGPVSKAYELLDAHAVVRLRRWLCAKHKARGAERSRYTDRYLHESLGLIRLPVLTQRFAWATA